VRISHSHNRRVQGCAFKSIPRQKSIHTTTENHGKVRISVKSLKRVIAHVCHSHLVSTFDGVPYRIKDAPLSFSGSRIRAVPNNHLIRTSKTFRCEVKVSPYFFVLILIQRVLYCYFYPVVIIKSGEEELNR
jgi:hypothetical protein